MVKAYHDTARTKRVSLVFAGALLAAAAWAVGADSAPAGHAESAAPAAPAAAVHVESAAPAVRSAPSAPAPVQQQPRSGSSNAGVQSNGSSVQNATPAQQHQAGQSHEQTNDRADHHRDRNLQFNYGNAWWGDSYWNGQDYNNGSYNNGTYNDVTYTPDGSVTNAPGGSEQAPVTPAAPASPSPDGSSNPAALQTNAVNNSPALVQANNQVQLAQVAYDKQRERVLAALNTQPDYQAALARRHDALHDLHDAKQQSPTTSPAVLEAATAKLDASDEVTKMQEQAVATDPQAQQARERLAQIVAHRDEVRAQLLGQH